MRRTLALTAALLALLAGVAACGDDAPGAAPSTEPVADAEAAYPVEVEHVHGTTAVEARPERIVSLNVQWTDAALALGVEPVAYVLDQASGETGPYPWQEGRLGDAERIDMTGTIPLEQVAALQPDLILVTWLAEEASVFDSLSAIAPTIGLLGGVQVDPWQDQVEVLGQVLGEPERADEVIAGTVAHVEDLAAELPALSGKTYALANYVPGDGIYVVADPEDGASRLFNDLGLELDPEILALDGAGSGRVQLSLEQASVLDADFLTILANGGDPADLAGWDQLTSVANGSVTDLGFADVVGINTPTPVSIPYVLELLRPGLEKVAAAS